MKSLFFALVLFCAVMINQQQAMSTPTGPTTISYQGILTDGNDELLTDGNYSVTFKIFDVSTGGVALWDETQNNVATVNGLFNVDLGSVQSITGIDYTKQLYLEVTVGSSTLSPRIKFTAQPYAFMAKTISETLPISKGGTGATTLQAAKDNLGISTLETNVSTLQTDVSNLKSDVSTLQSDITNIQSSGEFDDLSSTNDAIFNGVRVGKGGANISTNTTLGNNTLTNNTTGANNLAVGQNSLTTNTTGTGNSGIGRNTLNLNTTGSENTAVGRNALNKNTTASFNTAAGAFALRENTTGEHNTAVGTYSEQFNTTGNNNSSLGFQSLYKNTTGSGNTAVGFTASGQNTTGEFNTAIGIAAMEKNTTGNRNTALGHQALYGEENNTTGSENTAVGSSALYKNTTGEGNTAVGYKAGFGSGSGNEQSTKDNYSTFIGFQASRSETVSNSTSLTNITAIGKNAKVATDNSIVLGGTGSDAVNVGIGTTSPSARLEVVGNSKFDGGIQIPTGASAGKILTSDANGNATWANAPTIDLTSGITGSLSLANGGTGATTAAGARTNLGLGSISTQAVDSITITGGAINGTAIGATSASTGKFTTLETGTLKVTTGASAGKILTSDSSGNATWANAPTIDLTSGITGSLSLANGGTGATTAAGARTNLGLGTISTQAADNIAITGGAINGTAIGATSASTGKFTTLETGTLKVTTGASAGKILTSDANGNATWANAPTIDLTSGITGSLSLANGGTGSTTAAGARTNLGLGTISIQAANSVAITGGAINGTAIGATTASTGKFTTLETGSLKVTGGSPSAGKILTSDSSGNATWENAPTIDLTSGITGSLSLANGGTGSTTAAGARTNLGLGSISTQAANSVAITGGAINGTTIGATTASTGKFTTLETGSLKVTGGSPSAGKILTSDSSGNATWTTAPSAGTLSYSTTAPDTLQGQNVLVDLRGVSSNVIFVDQDKNDANNIIDFFPPNGTNGKVVYLHIKFKNKNDKITNSGIKDFRTGNDIIINQHLTFNHTIAMIYMNNEWWSITPNL